jgi:hypothetical protein
MGIAMISGKKSIFFSVVMAIAAVLLLCGYLQAVSPQAIRNPRLEHAHVRMQIIIDGQDVNFGDAKYQTPKSAVCTDELSAQPIHFHDNQNQFIHLHWKGLTGGLVLKNYGWNLIGGPNGILGYRADHLPLLNTVPVFGDVLPSQPQGESLWVYTGDDNTFTLRSTQDFLMQDLETFLGTKSTIGSKPGPDLLTSLLFTRASAHETSTSTHSQEELTRINNLLGNIVIFVQKDRPADMQVKDRFSHLEPLGESTCGG